MVDEFQDTNRLQLDLVSLLAKGLPGDGRGRTAECLRGGRRRPIDLRLARRGGLQHPGIRGSTFPEPAIVKLEQNYRSTNAILSTANSLIRNNPRRRPKKLWSANGDGEKVRIIQMPDDRQEAQFIAEEIQRRQHDGLRRRGRSSRSSSA